MIAKISVGTDRFEMWQIGRDLGLEGSVLERFKSAAYMVELTLEIDEKTGESKIIAVDGRQVAP